MGVRGALLVLVAALWTAIAPTPLYGADDEPTATKNRLLVIAGEKAGNAKPGSYCLTSAPPRPGSPGMRECSSVSYDPTPRRLFHVSAGSTIAMCAGSPAIKMSVAIVRDGKRGPRQLSSHRARRLDRSGQCWRARLPKPLGRATSVDIRVDYSQTDFARFTAGITVKN